MFATILAFFAKLGLGGIINKAADILTARAAAETDREKLRTELAAEHLRQIVEETRIMADLNKAKLSFPWFWVLVTMFVAPLGLWWTMVILDSIFYFPFDIAHLPNAEMRQWAGDMIRWLFYVGSGAAALRAAVK